LKEFGPYWPARRWTGRLFPSVPFGSQHGLPEKAAEVHLDFFEAYDLDLLKVMNDYDYPLPEGLREWKQRRT